MPSHRPAATSSLMSRSREGGRRWSVRNASAGVNPVEVYDVNQSADPSPLFAVFDVFVNDKAGKLFKNDDD